MHMYFRIFLYSKIRFFSGAPELLSAAIKEPLQWQPQCDVCP